MASSDIIDYYKPSKRAWVAVSVGFLALAAIVYVICASDISLKVQNNLGVELKIGEGSTEINVQNFIERGPVGI